MMLVLTLSESDVTLIITNHISVLKIIVPNITLKSWIIEAMITEV